jgi:hypothetical protein
VRSGEEVTHKYLLGRVAVSRLVTAETLKRDILLFAYTGAYTGRAKLATGKWWVGKRIYVVDAKMRSRSEYEQREKPDESKTNYLNIFYSLLCEPRHSESQLLGTV